MNQSLGSGLSRLKFWHNNRCYIGYVERTIITRAILDAQSHYPISNKYYTIKKLSLNIKRYIVLERVISFLTFSTGTASFSHSVAKLLRLNEHTSISGFWSCALRITTPTLLTSSNSSFLHDLTICKVRRIAAAEKFVKCCPKME
jgi:hypothetical protein